MSSASSKKEKALIKVIVLGCANVGKTSIMERFATGRFSGLRRPTVGADFLSKKIDIHGVEVSLQVWDTAGQERFHQGSLGNSFYRGSHGALLVYDVNNAASMEQVAQWRDECIQHNDGPDNYFPIVVIGNKVDLRDQTSPENRVDQSGILAWCQDQSYGHIETSAKDGLGVEAAMVAISGLALETQRARKRSSTGGAGSADPDVIDKTRLSMMYEPKKKGLCEGCM
jgi:Ras-related protein Rab-7A